MIFFLKTALESKKPWALRETPGTRVIKNLCRGLAIGGNVGSFHGGNVGSFLLVIIVYDDTMHILTSINEERP